jgi:hypothetical protein
MVTKLMIDDYGVEAGFVWSYLLELDIAATRPVDQYWNTDDGALPRNVESLRNDLNY